MAEPVRIHPREEPDDDESGRCSLIRVVELPDGRLEMRDTPLTPEDFLDPQIGDVMTQGSTHALVAFFLFDLLLRHFRGRADALVLHDCKHLFGIPKKAPSPDLSVILGLPRIAPEYESYDVEKEGVVPSLIVEVVSPSDARIRNVDEQDKVKLYERAGVSEYVMVRPPRLKRGERGYRLRGYRLDALGRYRPIEPDADGRLLAETVGLQLGVSADGDWIVLYDAETGTPLRSSVEEEDARKAAEQARQVAEQARDESEMRAGAAEAEAARLREELERLRGRR
jgi:Uma2 family endonuclease